MAQIKADTFNVFVRPPNNPLDHRALAETILKGVREEEKIYGPVFKVRFIKNALDYLTPRIGEKPSKDISDLSQLMDFIASKSAKYPSLECVISYAQVKTENEFQGQTGAGTTIEHTTVARQVLADEKVKERNVDFDSAFAVFSQMLQKIKIHPDELGYKKNGDGSAEIELTNCYFRDSCEQCMREHILKRTDGKQRCGAVGFTCQSLKPLTGYQWDYEAIEAPKDRCLIKCHMI